MKSITITAEQYNRLYDKYNFELPPTDEWSDTFAENPNTGQVDVAESFEFSEDGTYEYLIGKERYSNNYRWSGEDFTRLEFDALLTELFILKGEEEYLNIVVDARDLYDKGWEFEFGDNDYEGFLNGGWNHKYTDDELKDYESWLDASEVSISISENGQVGYLSGKKGTDWSQADAYVDTGDAKKTIIDLIEIHSNSKEMKTIELVKLMRNETTQIKSSTGGLPAYRRVMDAVISGSQPKDYFAGISNQEIAEYVEKNCNASDIEQAKHIYARKQY